MRLLSDAMVRAFEVSAPNKRYLDGWGEQCGHAKYAICSWHITVFDTTQNHVMLGFHLVNGHSPLIVGMDLWRYSDSHNITSPTMMTFQRPSDARQFALPTYIDEDAGGDQTLRLGIVPHRNSSLTFMLPKTGTRHELNLVRKVHRSAHANVAEMKKLLYRTDLDKEEINVAYQFF